MKASAPTKTSSRAPKTLGKSLKGWLSLGVFVVVGLFGVFSLLGENGLLEIFRLKAMHAQIESENHKLLIEQQALHEEIVRLQDPKYLEYMAREELGMIGPKEYFILLDTSEDTPEIKTNL